MKPGTISSDRKKRNFAVRILNFCKLVIEILKFSSKKTSRYSILRYYQACCTGMNQRTCGVMIVTIRMKKAFRNTQTLRARCSKAQPKKIAPPRTPFPWAQNDQNLISWRWSPPLPTPSLVRINARNFELSW